MSNKSREHRVPFPSLDEILDWPATQAFLQDLQLFGSGFRAHHARQYFLPKLDAFHRSNGQLPSNAILTKSTKRVLSLLHLANKLRVEKNVPVVAQPVVTEKALVDRLRQSHLSDFDAQHSQMQLPLEDCRWHETDDGMVEFEERTPAVDELWQVLNDQNVVERFRGASIVNSRFYFPADCEFPHSPDSVFGSSRSIIWNSKVDLTYSSNRALALTRPTVIDNFGSIFIYVQKWLTDFEDWLNEDGISLRWSAEEVKRTWKLCEFNDHDSNESLVGAYATIDEGACRHNEYSGSLLILLGSHEVAYLRKDFFQYDHPKYGASDADFVIY